MITSIGSLPHSPRILSLGDLPSLSTRTDEEIYCAFYHVTFNAYKEKTANIFLYFKHRKNNFIVRDVRRIIVYK